MLSDSLWHALDNLPVQVTIFHLISFDAKNNVASTGKYQGRYTIFFI